MILVGLLNLNTRGGKLTGMNLGPQRFKFLPLFGFSFKAFLPLTQFLHLGSSSQLAVELLHIAPRDAIVAWRISRDVSSSF